MKKVITSMTISVTKADTSLFTAPPIMEASAKPTMPYLFRNCVNSSMNPLGFWGYGDGFGSCASLILRSSFKSSS